MIRKTLPLLMVAVLPLQLFSLTKKTSTGGTSSSPLNWSNSATWSSSGSGTPLVYTIRPGDYISFHASNSSPFVDTLFDFGNLIMANNKVMTLTAGGVLQLMNNTATISGGSNNTQFVWNGTGVVLTGPFTSSNIVTNGPRYATAGTVTAAGGAIQGSFVAGILPIFITDWRVKNEGDYVTFNWHSNMETKDCEFVIKHSLDFKNWYDVIKVDANADSSNPGFYQCSIAKKHIPDLREKGNYFILDLIADNESFYHTAAIHFVNSGDKSTILNINVTPNPATEDPLVEIFSLNPGTVELTVCMLSGETVKKYNLNFEDNVVKQGIIIRDLNPGPYILRASAGTTNCSMKLVRQ